MAAGAAGAITWAGAAAASESSTGQPQFVPVPKHARPPAIPPKGYLLDRLGENLYGVRDSSYQSMFLVTRVGVVVVDAPLGFGDKLLAAIDEVTQRPVTHVVYSHSHLDHIGSAHLFGKRANYVAHELTGELLKRAGDARRPVPSHTFKGDKHVLVAGGERLVLEYRGNNHQAGNLFISAPESRVLMLVDVVTPRWAPFYQLGLTPNVRTYIDATDQILRYDFDTIVTGHSGHFGTREDIEINGRYLADLQKATGDAFRTVDYGEAVKGASGDNYQAASKLYLDALVNRSVELMPARWLTRLGGADVFLRDNAAALLWNLMIG